VPEETYDLFHFLFGQFVNWTIPEAHQEPSTAAWKVINSDPAKKVLIKEAW